MDRFVVVADAGAGDRPSPVGPVARVSAFDHRAVTVTAAAPTRRTAPVADAA